MNILFNIKVNIFVFIKWPYKSSLYMLIIQPRMVRIFWALYSISFLSNMSFWLFVHRSTPSHIPLKCRYVVYCYVRFRHVRLMAPKFVIERLYVFWPLASKIHDQLRYACFVWLLFLIRDFIISVCCEDQKNKHHKDTSFKENRLCFQILLTTPH